VVDVWPFISPVTLAILDEADTILLVLTPEISSLHNARLWLHLADERGYTDSSLHLVLNQDSGQKGFLEGEISRLLDYPLFHSIPFEPSLVRGSLNRGVPLVLASKGGRLAQSFVSLSERVTGLQSMVPGLTSRQAPRGLSGLKQAGVRA
jgi:pilus assembly protein CpaE